MFELWLWCEGGRQESLLCACHHAVIVSWASVIIISSEHAVQTHCLTWLTQQTSEYVTRVHVWITHITSLILFAQSKICSINKLLWPKAADIPTELLIHCVHVQKHDNEKPPSWATTEWYSRVGSWEFFILFPQDLMFLVIRRAF